VSLFSLLWSTPPYLVGPLWPRSTPYGCTVLGSTMVLSSSFLQARSVDLHSSIVPTRPTRVFPIGLAAHQCLHRPVPATTHRHVVSMRLRVDLTRISLLLRVHLMRCCARLELLPETLLPTFFCQKLFCQPSSALSSVTAAAQWTFLLLFLFSLYC
jgi:hypothetical protein